nr:hypothetical protein [Tanacetum cinerariifolium]
MDTKIEKSSVIRQPNAFKSPRPSILGKPTTFSNSFIRNDFSKSTSVPKNNVTNDFSIPVPAQTLPATMESCLKNTNVLAPGMYKIRTTHTQSRTSKLPQDSKKTNKSFIEIILFIIDSGSSKHMTRNLKLLSNFVEKFLDAVKFGNDQIASILGSGDLVHGDVTMKRANYIEGLNHNSFSIGSHGTDLYSMTLQDTSTPDPICLMAKASSSQAWLWHLRLLHLNFDTINLLLKHHIVTGLPKLKFINDHFCSSCELGKSKLLTDDFLSNDVQKDVVDKIWQHTSNIHIRVSIPIFSSYSIPMINGALTWWNSHKRTVRTDAAYAMTWRALMKLMTEEKDRVKKFIGGLPNNSQGNVIVVEPGHYRSDCPNLKNQNRGNKIGNKLNEAKGRAYALGGGANPDSNVVMGKANVVADALSRKKRVKLIQVRALVMTIGLNLPVQILKAQAKARKEENYGLKYLCGLIKKLEPRSNVTLCLKNRSWIPCLGDLRNRIYGETDKTVLEGSRLEVWSTGFDHSDRDNRFTSHFWQSLQEALGSRLDMSTAYHSQTDGQSERTIQTLEDMLRACVIDFEKGWDRHFPLVEFSYNNSYHAIIKVASFEALYGRKCQSSIYWVEVGESQLIGLEIVHEMMEKIIQIKNRIQATRDHQKSHANLHFIEEPVEIMDSEVKRLKKNRLSDETLAISLDEIQIDDKLHFIEEPVKIMHYEVKRMKQIRIPIVKVRTLEL